MKCSATIHSNAGNTVEGRIDVFYVGKNIQEACKCGDCKYYFSSKSKEKDERSCTRFDCYVPADDHICGVFKLAESKYNK